MYGAAVLWIAAAAGGSLYLFVYEGRPAQRSALEFCPARGHPASDATVDPMAAAFKEAERSDPARRSDCSSRR